MRSVPVRLNIDLGELPDEREALYALAHVANVACGGHAGDADSMARAVALCRQYGTLLAAHPSYADRAGFGRRATEMPARVLASQVADQCATLKEIAARAGVRVAWVKPHGALYHAAHEKDVVARAVVEGAIAALGHGIVIVGPEGGELEAVARELGPGFAREGFADRAVREGGALVPRDEPGAVITDVGIAVDNAVRLAQAGAVETICVHGDTPGAETIARAVRAALDALAAAGTRN